MARPEGYVDGPVTSAWLAELAGAVERIDDPHAVGGQSCLVVDALFGEDRVIGPGLRQFGHQEFVGLAISGVTQGVRVAASGAQG
jgi:hypothetical protein